MKYDRVTQNKWPSRGSKHRAEVSVRKIDEGPYGMSNIRIGIGDHIEEPFSVSVITTAFGSQVRVAEADDLLIATANIDIKGVALTTEDQTAAAEWLHDMALTMNAK